MKDSIIPLIFIAIISILIAIILVGPAENNNTPKTSPEALQSTIVFDSINVKVTCYHATTIECGNDLGICYDGTKVCKGTIALSPDIFYYNRIKLGDTILLLGTPMDGVYIVHDKTANNIKNTADIFINPNEKGFSERGIIIWRY